MPLAIWVAVSFAFHIAAALGLDAARTRMARASESSAPERAAAGVLRWLWRAVFFLGVPYAALLTGVATPAQFALQPPDAAQVGALLLPALTVALAGAFVAAAIARLSSARYPAGVRPAVRRRAQLAQPWGVSFLVLDALYLQAHWTFYRAGTALALPAFTVWGGLVLIVAEWALDPAWRREVGTPGLWEDAALLLLLAILSAYLAALGVDFWLSICVHVLLWIGWLAVLHVASRAPQENRVV